MTRHLLDANVLIALAVTNHVHADAAHSWLSSAETFATCSITEMSLLRLLIRTGVPGAQAMRLLEEITDQQSHEFWPDPIRPTAGNMRGVIGHRQVTDFYLAALTRHHGGRLATFDRGLEAAHPDVVTLVSDAGTA